MEENVCLREKELQSVRRKVREKKDVEGDVVRKRYIALSFWDHPVCMILFLVFRIILGSPWIPFLFESKII